MFSTNVVVQTGYEPVLKRAALQVLRHVVAATLIIACAMSINGIAASQAPAQIPKINLQGPHTLVGIVVDSAGAPIAGAEVSLPTLGWITRSRANGAFRFDSIKVKSVEVRVRALGWIAPNESVGIGTGGGSVVIRMTRITQLMPDVVTKAVRGGLRGVVVDSALRPISNVKVQAIGGQSDTVTDANGAYFFPLKAGHYMLRLDRDGYERQMVGATVADTMAANVVTIMYGRVGKPNIIEGASLTELGDRMFAIRHPRRNTFRARISIR